MRKLIELVEIYDPAFSTTIEGASSEEIALLEEYTGSKLPLCYHEFLGIMGRSMGSLHLLNLSFNITDILAFYQESSSSIPKDYILIGEALNYPSYDLYLACKSIEPAPVVMFDLGDFDKTPYTFKVSASLQDFLLPIAFKQKRMSTFNHHKPYGLSNIDVDTIGNYLAEEAARIGFKKLLPTGLEYSFFDAEDGSIVIRKDIERPDIYVDIATKKADTTTAIAKKLQLL